MIIRKTVRIVNILSAFLGSCSPQTFMVIIFILRSYAYCNRITNCIYFNKFKKKKSKRNRKYNLLSSISKYVDDNIVFVRFPNKDVLFVFRFR